MKYTYLLLAVLVVLTCFAPTAVVDNSLEVWVDLKRDEGRRWQNFLAEFGSSEFVVIALKCEDPFTATNLEMFLDLEQRLERLPQVEAVLGPGKIHREFPEISIEAFRKEMTASPFYRRFLVGKDGSVAGIFVHLKTIEAKPDARQKIAADIRAEVAITTARRPDVSAYLAGPTLLNAELDIASRRSAETLTPLCVLVVLVWMALMVKSLWSGLSVLAAVGLSIGATVGIMAILGVSLNMLTTAMPGLLLILGVATAVHIVHRSHALESDGAPKGEAITQAMRELRHPCSNATITTAVGFSSLAVSTMPAVREFGIFTAVGLILGLFANLILLPWFLSASWNRVRPHREFLTTTALGLGRFGYHRRRLVTAVALLLTGYAAYLATGFEVEANTLKFLPDNNSTVRDSQFIAENLTGLYSLELDVRVKGPIPWHWIDGFCRELEKNPAVSRVYSPTDLIKKMNALDEEDPKSYRLPEQLGYIDLYIVSMPRLLAEEWSRRCKDNDRHMRISILIHEMRSNLYHTVFTDIDRLIASSPPGLSLTATGIISLVTRAQEQLIQTQIKSFALSAAIICLMLALALRRWRIIVAAIPDNLLPPLLSFALMVALGIKIDAGTVIVASIAIGMAVDNTIHICERFQSLAAERSVEQALCGTLKITGSPIIATSLIISAGFAAMLLAPFRPLVYFGGLTMFAVLAALICDLLWLPALLGILVPEKIQGKE